MPRRPPPSLSRARLVIIIRSVTDRQPAVLLCLSTPAEAVHRPSLPTGAGGERRSNQPAEAMLRARLRASIMWWAQGIGPSLGAAQTNVPAPAGEDRSQPHSIHPTAQNHSSPDGKWNTVRPSGRSGTPAHVAGTARTPAALCRHGEARSRVSEEENAAAERVRLCSAERPAA